MAKTTVMCAFLMSAVGFGAACASDDHASNAEMERRDAHASETVGDPERGVAAPAEASARRSAAGDAEILAELIALHEHEMNAATEAQKKEVDAEVMEYARMLHRDHKKGLDETKNLAASLGIAPADTSAVKKSRDAAARDESALARLQGDDFARAYLDAMVKGHENALQKIDKKLLPSVANDSVRRNLSETRGHIAHHLERGKALQRARG